MFPHIVLMVRITGIDGGLLHILGGTLRQISVLTTFAHVI
jgi:hypothetical protein